LRLNAIHLAFPAHHNPAKLIAKMSHFTPCNPKRLIPRTHRNAISIPSLLNSNIIDLTTTPPSFRQIASTITTTTTTHACPHIAQNTTAHYPHRALILHTATTLGLRISTFKAAADFKDAVERQIPPHKRHFCVTHDAQDRMIAKRLVQRMSEKIAVRKARKRYLDMWRRWERAEMERVEEEVGVLGLEGG